MTENELRNAVVAEAKSWLGCKESDGAHREIIDIYNSIKPLPRGYRMTYADPWCAAYVSAVAKVVGMTDIIFPECGCEQMIELYKQHGRWEEDDSYSPLPGDIIFYDWQDDGEGDNQGASDHVGIVVKNECTVIQIIEGNSSDAVQRNLRHVDSRYIRGYGLPDYASKAEDEPEPEPEPEPSEAPLPTLMVGDGMDRNYDLMESVRSAQLLLKGRGYSVGWMGCDGEFGLRTESAVGKFQGDYHLEKTGIINMETWIALITGVKAYD